jgi:hypothetical protein
VSGGGVVRALAQFFLLNIMIRNSPACSRKKLALEYMKHYQLSLILANDWFAKPNLIISSVS